MAEPFSVVALGSLVVSATRTLITAVQRAQANAAFQEFAARELRTLRVGNALQVLGATASVAGTIVAIRGQRAEQHAAREQAALLRQLAREAREHDQLMQAIQHAYDKELQRQAVELQAALADYTAVKDTYPFAGALAATGELRRQLDLEGRELPVLLLAPRHPEEPPNHPWHGLRRRLLTELDRYRHTVRVRAAERHFTWPHAGLLRYDLDRLPVLTVDLLPAGGSRLDITLAASRMLPGELYQTMPPCVVGSLHFDPDLQWSLGDPRQSSEDRNLEFAARWVAFQLIGVIDAHHLTTRPHAEQIDVAAARVGREVMPWPVDHGLRLADISDPAYHLLHRVRRHLHRGERDLAEDNLHRALALLGADQQSRLTAALKTAARSGAMTASHLELLREVLADFDGKGRLGRHLSDARPADLPAGQPRPQPPGPPSSWLPRGTPPPL